jgi:hypothetical protein
MAKIETMKIMPPANFLKRGQDFVIELSKMLNELREDLKQTYSALQVAYQNAAGDVKILADNAHDLLHNQMSLRDRALTNAASKFKVFKH